MTDDRSRWKRLFAAPNVVSVLVGVAIFVVGLRFWDNTLGVVVVAMAAALASGLAWMLWWYRTGPPAATRSIDVVHLGTAEHAPGAAPTLLDVDSPQGRAYRDMVGTMTARTSGQVLLISPTHEPAAPSTIAVNIAAAATQLGRRTVLVDGHSNGSGLSRYSSTGTGTGLSDLAADDASLADAAQVWKLDGGSLLPVITAGTGDGDPALDGLALAEAFDVLAERADLIIIDVPPVTGSGSAGQLAAHADGTVLVVDDRTTTAEVIDAAEGLDRAGAPIVAYITEQPEGASRLPWGRMLKRSGVAFLLISLTYLAYAGTLLWSSWAAVERETLDTETARAVIPAPATLPPSDLVGEEPIEQVEQEPIEDVVVAEPAPAEGYTSLLLIGTDAAAGIADVILLGVIPADGSEPFIVSLPRDLYVPNNCGSGYTRINAMLHPCGDINGPTRLSLAVEDFTGISVDHFALFDFDGFANIVDGVGGVEICVDYERRDRRAQLHLEAGCTLADGPTALAWVRSRHPIELVDGVWRPVPGVSDLYRNRNQQDVVLQLVDKLKSFDSPTDLARKVNELSEAFVLDNRLGITAAIALAWSVRDLDVATINRLEIPVVYATTTSGQSVLRATAPFDEVLAELYPNLLDEGSDDAPAASD